MSKKEILIIEDDEAFRNAIKYAFHDEGFAFLEAESVEQGIEIIEKNPQVRVVILDLFFKKHNGTTFLKHIKGESSRYRVIVLTGHEELLAAEIASEYDVFNYLPKVQPDAFSVQSLRFTVEQAFNDIERKLLTDKTNKLLNIQKKINSNDKLGEILELICQSIRELVGGYTCHIRVYDFVKGDLALAAFNGPSEKMRDIFKNPKTKGQFYYETIERRKDSIVFDDLRINEEFNEFQNTMLDSDDVTEDVREEMRSYFNAIRSAYLIPVFTNTLGSEVDAVVNISSDSIAYFTDERRKLVDEFVNQAAIAITKKWLESKRLEAIQDYGRISKMLGKVSDQLTGDNIQDKICAAVIRGIRKIVKPETVAIFLYNEKTGKLENVAEQRGNDKNIIKPDESYEPGQSLTGSVYRQGETIRRPDPKRGILTRPTKDKLYDWANEAKYSEYVPSGRVEDYIGVPIKIGDFTMGVLRAINKKSAYYETEDFKSNPFCLLSRGFSDDCQNTLEIAASHLAIAIRNAQQIEQFKTLNEVGRLISSEMNIDELLKLTIEKTAEVMRAEICMLFLKDETGNKLTLHESYGIPKNENWFYEIGKGITGTLAVNGIPQLIKHDDKNAGKYDKEILDFLREKHGQEKSIESVMAVPIVAKGNILGVIKVINKLGDHFQYEDADLRFFQIFASSVGIAVENAKIYDLANQKLAIAERNSTLSLLVRSVAHEINNTSGQIPANVDGIRDALRVIATVVHEIESNLGLIPSKVQSIRAELASSNEAIEEMLEVIEDSAMQAVEFANEIAGFSATRMGIGKVMDINGVIVKAIARFLPELKRNENFAHILLEVNLSNESIYCHIYEPPLIQIVRNMIINAYQAMEMKDRGMLTITTGKDTEMNLARLEFADNGCGIAEGDIEKIFEPDFTTKERGNGLGLWLIKNHLERIDGVIQVKSVLDEGTTFSIEIPLNKQSEQQGGNNEQSH